MRNPISSMRETVIRFLGMVEEIRARIAHVEQRMAEQADEIRAITFEVRGGKAAAIDLSFDLLVKTDPRYRDKRHVGAAHGQVYSQNNEDGIIADIFSRVGTTTKTFLEIAAGNGIENVTRLLLDLGWSGIWVEAGDAEAQSIRQLLAGPISDGRLVFLQKKVDRDNVVELLRGTLPDELDFLSLDIDYNTSHIWSALKSLRPRVICVEYNAHFPPSIDYEAPYIPDGVWDGSTRFGASLKALERIGRDAGYKLVGCDIFGVNAYFVREDLCDEKTFLAPFTAENHYEPPRYSAVHMRGHGRYTKSSAR
ncbi:hypothetical protein [Rhizobium sp. BK068]|uniref:hypothetical protein n=1 Tax=Rhizobium sp. BK068 TaxID=2512130 RepID=UPI0010530261|nr:hypothetical protein [Rhizobium sp. BK068]TCM65872.1 hypothetical protein EV291_14114 [Rhizobium sp. BK068]